MQVEFDFGQPLVPRGWLLSDGDGRPEGVPGDACREQVEEGAATHS